MPGFILLNIFMIFIILFGSLYIYLVYKDMMARINLYKSVDDNVSNFIKTLNKYINCESRRFKEDTGISEQDSKLESDVERQSTQVMDAGQQPEDFADIISKRTQTAVNFGEDV